VAPVFLAYPVGRFYKYVNARLAKKHGVGTLRDDKGEAVVGNSERADLLNNYFCSVYVTDNGILPNLDDRYGASRHIICHLILATLQRQSGS